MGIQINTQPQVFTSLNSTSVSAQNLTAIRGTFTTSVSSPAISAGKFTGDGSGLTGVVGVAAGVTSINGLTGAVTNVVTTSGAAFTGNITSPSVSATAISAAKFTGDGSGLTGIAGVGSGVTSINGLTGIVTNVVTTSGATLTGNLLAPSVSATAISAVNYLSGGNNFTNIFATKASLDNTYNIVSANSADWTIGKTLSTSGGRLNGNVTVNGNLTANYITTLSGTTFVNTVFTTTSALCVIADPINIGPAFYVGARGSGDIASFYDTDQNVEVLHVGGANGNFPNVGIKISNPTETLTVSGTVSALSTAWFGNLISNNDLTAKRATFTTSVSSPAISAGKFTGDGSGLTGIAGVGSGVTSINGLTGVVTNVVTTSGATLTGNLNLSAASLTAVNGTFTTSVSSPALSCNTLTISGYRITPVTTVYSVASGATSTYTLALSDNNNTLTLNLGTSGIVLISSSITYPVGYQTNVIQLSTGRVTLSSGSGITLRNDLSFYRTLQQYSAATLINLGSVWVCYGSLSS